ncbi:MAG: hypothetical protein G3M78_01605 [Candidatus Nitrohelix vancouverensis]|uniref:Uncharacterized protein n=1 Tax=Candidatus Nitrohelix vancouverensis TaxID=2705534 RepID=A0A7T0C0A8_9BACT|nr:MAG: hypothetical protein G3M78_01605 [Candidatus Nitrohelix vancouverensis]
MSQEAHCQECGNVVESLPTQVEYQGQEIHLFNPVICVDCLQQLCERHSATCANCGGAIPPYTQVGVLKAESGEKQLIHMNTACSTAGSAFHGYWGKGELREFIQIEAC